MDVGFVPDERLMVDSGTEIIPVDSWKRKKSIWRVR